MLQTALHYSHELLKEIVQPGDVVVDGTMGNGFDTVFLAELVGKTGLVYAFDVQEQALTTTTERLKAEKLLERTQLLLQGHETLSQVIPEIQPIKSALFNLGYLPHSDKSIITTEATTIPALTALISRLVTRGRIILVIYSGHEGGEAEKQAVLNFATELPQEDFSVLYYEFINQKHSPPSLVCIERKKSPKK
ncbi:SAM-dependent methyltransferase [Vagococcus penaei]|uniref:SAM-dependent methyltransferase n=1 Tax=Vagococcus penaei TaxID=633807 RepID=A0A1Q2D6J5_9ENTE|nr:class I SAM-dependent methyltransferase [Vagococcus penaei]AQP53944.1 SAM-dependent methyltransferase [Vagococcus penaei]RSU02892.1 SAM-dependent methyltransferase [Vagococcus penaei]